MIPGLRHDYAGLDDSEFFKKIDECGGWPVGFQYVGFEHTDVRAAGFSNSCHNTGWWTTLFNADDYYIWKLSPKALQAIVDAAIDAARVTRVDAGRMFLRNWRGHTATRQVAAREPK